MAVNRLPSYLVRKSLLLILVIILTCCSIHFKGRQNKRKGHESISTPIVVINNENVPVPLQPDDERNFPSIASETGNHNKDDNDLTMQGIAYMSDAMLSQIDSHITSPEQKSDQQQTKINDNSNNNNNNNNNNNESRWRRPVSLFRIRRLHQQEQLQQKKANKSNAKAEIENRNSTNTKITNIGQSKVNKEKIGRNLVNETSAKSNKNKSDDKSKSKPKSPVLIPILAPTNSCTNPAYMEFPSDIFGDRGRSRGAIIIHIAVVLYMFYCLAIVCENYFLPSLEECAQRLNLSEDVAGATLMAAGSSAPELFTATLGVFIAKGDVGTGTIVGSAVFNILFVIGLCSLYTVSTELNWWPVARDSAYYTFTVLVLIVCIYDGEVTTFESFVLLALYGVYIIIMNHNIVLRDLVLRQWQIHFKHQPIDELNSINIGGIGGSGGVGGGGALQSMHSYQSISRQTYSNNYDTDYGDGSGGGGYTTQNPFIVRVPKMSLFEAANRVIIKHKRLFRALTRFRAAAHIVIIETRKRNAPHETRTLSMSDARKMSRLGVDDQFWRKVPDPNIDGIEACAKWAVMAPLYATLYYTIPDCKTKSNAFFLTFAASITWTAIFSYIMVWMVTLIGFTLGIPDSIMGITFLAAGTSVPDAYASLHVTKLGQADMAVSNSIGSNVFDILVGLALPWFVETAIVDPGSVSSINSRGLIYAVVLLFVSLLSTIYLFHLHRWTLNPRLGYSLLATYVVFLIISSALEFNLFGYVNPPICGESLS